MRINNVIIGADPELFIINEKTGKVVSAVGMIPGEKGKPFVEEDWDKGYGLETDNILAEFNIPPATTMMGFVNSIEFMKTYIRKFVKRINPNYGILCKASMLVDDDQLQTDQAKEFGCSVDYNAYTEEPNPKPEGTKTNLRSAGSHLHISYDNPDIDTSLELIKYLDVFVGLPSVLWDPDTERRKLYGKAGCFRLCKYGCEFRVLSSAMIQDVDTIKNVYKQVIKAIRAFNNNYLRPDPELVQRAINDSDVNLAQTLN